MICPHCGLGLVGNNLCNRCKKFWSIEDMNKEFQKQLENRTGHLKNIQRIIHYEYHAGICCQKIQKYINEAREKAEYGKIYHKL